MRIASFDPGERTGFAVVDVTQGFKFPRTRKGTFKPVEQGVLTVREMAKELPGLIRDADVVVYESWRLFPASAQALIGSQMTPSQVVGFIRYEAWQQGKRTRSQAPAIKTRSVELMPKWLVEHMELSSEQHDQDAIMHAHWCACKLLEEGRLGCRSGN